jgi:hypothetical protein
MPHEIHEDHDHEHGPECGHEGYHHNDHTDYVHDGHRHRRHDDHWDECAPAADAGPSTIDHAIGAE